MRAVEHGLDRNYTMKEAADWLHVGRRTLQDVIKRHRFYFVAGRRKLFSDAHLHALADVIGLRHEDRPKRMMFLAPAPPTRKSVVYILRSGDYIKIGFSRNFESRLASIRSVSAHEIVIVAVMPGRKRVEFELHRRFAHLRHHHEWFRHEGDLAEYIAGLPK